MAVPSAPPSAGLDLPAPASAGLDLFPLKRFPVHASYRIGEARKTVHGWVEPNEVGVQRFVVEGELELSIRCRIEGATFEVQSEVVGHRAGMRLDEVTVFSIDCARDEPGMTFFHNGWQSWTGTSALSRNMREPRPTMPFWDIIVTAPSSPRFTSRGHFTSDLFTVAADPVSGGALVLGFVTSASQFGAFDIDARSGRRPTLSARLPFDAVTLVPGRVRRGETLRVEWGADISEMLERYTTLLGRNMHARTTAHDAIGWCSWYYYFTAIDEAAIRKNLETLSQWRDRIPVTHFQIDDGYQKEIGEWLIPNKKFPAGVAPLAREIRSKGMEAGLWLAPFIAESRARITREHPEWFVRDDKGRPRYALFNPGWELAGVQKALDVTHPGVREWLTHVFRTVAGEWGFSFLKLDFLYATALPGARYDQTLTSAEALRLGLQTIRDAVGEDVHLLGCGAPLGPSIGIVDSMRIGMDVAPYWEDYKSTYVGRGFDMMSTKVALRNAMSRSFMHGRLWRNDPDCILVRDRNTKLTLDEVRSLTSIAILCGGTLLFSDDLTELSEGRVAILEKAVALRNQLNGSSPRTLDIMRPGFPQVLWATRKSAGGFMAVINSDDEAQSVSIPLPQGFPLWPRDHADGTVHDFWTGERFPIVDGVLMLGIVPAHATRLLEFSPSEGRG